MARPTSEERVIIAQRRARVLAMRIEQVPYTEIAAREGIAESTARSDYARARDQARADLAATVTEARELELAKLDALERAIWEVLRREHIVIQHGKVVRLGRKPVIDDDPVLRAADRLVKISERRARLRGLDAPVKVEVSDEVDAELQRLAAELAVMEPGRETQAAGDAASG